MKSKLLLGDEPTGNLDTENSENIVELLRKLSQEEQYRVVIATHDISILDRMDEVYRMQDGRLKAE